MFTEYVSMAKIRFKIGSLASMDTEVHGDRVGVTVSICKRYHFHTGWHIQLMLPSDIESCTLDKRLKLIQLDK